MLDRKGQERESVYRQTIIVKGAQIIHLGPCSEIAQVAGKRPCEIHLIAGEKQANARHVFEILTLGLKDGQELTVEAVGEEAEEAVREIVELFEKGFPKWKELASDAGEETLSAEEDQAKLEPDLD